MQYLLSSADREVKLFREYIRKYNSTLAFTSVKYNIDDQMRHMLAGIQCFQIHGELFYLHGPLQCENATTAQFAQLYFYDLQLATTVRQARNTDILQSEILQQLTDELTNVNPFISIYQTAKEHLDCEQNTREHLRIVLNPQLKLIVETGADKRRENLPTSK